MSKGTKSGPMSVLFTLIIEMQPFANKNNKWKEIHLELQFEYLAICGVMKSIRNRRSAEVVSISVLFWRYQVVANDW